MNAQLDIFSRASTRVSARGMERKRRPGSRHRQRGAGTSVSVVILTAARG